MLQPLVMGRAVSIHPLAVVLAIAAGAVLAGIVGALLAVPTVAFLNSAVRVLAAREPDAELEAQETEPGKVIEADADDVETAKRRLAPAAFPAQQVSGADAADATATPAIFLSLLCGQLLGRFRIRLALRGNRRRRLARPEGLVGRRAGPAPGSRWWALRPAAGGASVRAAAPRRGRCRAIRPATTRSRGPPERVAAVSRAWCAGAPRFALFTALRGLRLLAAGIRVVCGSPAGGVGRCVRMRVVPATGRSVRAGGRGLDPRRRGAWP